MITYRERLRQVLGITKIIHDHFPAATAITSQQRLGKNRDHFPAHPYNKTYSFSGSWKPVSVESGEREKRRVA
jgi:hypothetical protein